MDKQAKIDVIEGHVKAILTTLGVDTDNDPSTRDTPRRVAKMYVTELFAGLDPDNAPAMTAQPNDFEYNQMLIETNIKVHSCCEHHLVPIMGVAHIAYIPKDKVLGLSKFNRLVDYYARRPQVQEKLTEQIIAALKKALNTPDIAVVIDAAHMCVKLRGIKDQNTMTRTAALSGVFRDDPLARAEFFNALPKAAQSVT